MQINVKDLPATLAKVQAAVTAQSAYVAELASRYNAGKTEVRLFDGDGIGQIWVTVPLKEWWDLNQALYLKQAAFQTALSNALTLAQGAADNALVEVVKPPMEGVAL